MRDLSIPGAIQVGLGLALFLLWILGALDGGAFGADVPTESWLQHRIQWGPGYDEIRDRWYETHLFVDGEWRTR